MLQQVIYSNFLGHFAKSELPEDLIKMSYDLYDTNMCNGWKQVRVPLLFCGVAHSGNYFVCWPVIIVLSFRIEMVHDESTVLGLLTMVSI